MLQNETKGVSNPCDVGRIDISDNPGIGCELPTSQFIARLIHKMRNPLSVITTSVTQLQEDIRNRRTDDIDFLVLACIEGTDRLRQILSRLSDCICTDADDIEPVDLVQLLRDTVNEVREGCENETQTINFTLPSSRDKILLRCSLRQARMIFTELLNNAVENISGSGVVKITCREDNDKIAVAIVDSGEKIDPNITANIFDPFVTFKAGYTGLGLTLAQHMARLNDANIEIKPDGENGTKVIVIFSALNRL